MNLLKQKVHHNILKHTQLPHRVVVPRKRPEEDMVDENSVMTPEMGDHWLFLPHDVLGAYWRSVTSIKYRFKQDCIGMG
jgi:hypothetical protein